MTTTHDAEMIPLDNCTNCGGLYAQCDGRDVVCGNRKCRMFGFVLSAAKSADWHRQLRARA